MTDTTTTPTALFNLQDQDIIDSREVMDIIDWATNEASQGRDIGNMRRVALKDLMALHKMGPEYAEDWTYGVPMIRDSYFRTYAMDLAYDCGMIPDYPLEWPLRCIDWDQAARELQMDYTPVEFRGVTFWVR